MEELDPDVPPAPFPQFAIRHSHFQSTSRVPRACTGVNAGRRYGMMMYGSSTFGTRRLPDAISHCLDTEVSPPYPESWRGRVLEEASVEGVEGYAGL